MKFVLATANPGKIKEMREILSVAGIDVISRDELGISFDVEETGTTFDENALIKAKAICEASGLPAIADDSGLMVKALGSKPGVYSSSYGGVELSDFERCNYLLENMKNMEQREAKFVCIIVCAYPDGTTVTARGETQGVIAPLPRGKGGFGYDPVFIPDGMDKTMAELTLDEKNTLSHRGKALRAIASRLGNGGQE